ncbi:MAG: hypothetical protein GXO87_12085, partial [Chlorobi bacterium]|nr:hypothetical protein [Chlorobiota bacterium]
MKRVLSISVLFFGVFFLTSAVFAQTAPQKAQISAAQQAQVRTNWVDADGDGICDNFGTANQGVGNAYKKMNGMKGQGQGMGNGSGNGNHYGDGSGIRPQDGTGFGAGQGSGNGTCDGTGPKGNGRRGGGK